MVRRNNNRGVGTIEGVFVALFETFSGVHSEILYHHSFLQKLIKGGFGLKAGGLENFSKIYKRSGGTTIRYSE